MTINPASAARGPAFDQTVPPGGYLWWYLDGESDDGRYGLTVIAFVGSVFSPYYAWAGRKQPDNHCAINVALYDLCGSGKGRWCMTERAQSAVTRSADSFRVGPSSLIRQEDGLLYEIAERSAPIPRPVSGRISVTPVIQPRIQVALDPHGRHGWQPVAPHCRLSLSFDRPDLHWEGDGYFDCNWGSEPLEAGFRRWSWARGHGKDAALIAYDSIARDGSRKAMGLRLGDDGQVEERVLPPSRALKAGIWGVDRHAHGDRDNPITLQHSLEDTPFYTRSRLDLTLFGERLTAFHETLDLDRFASPLIRALLPFRMPRGLFW